MPEKGGSVGGYSIAGACGGGGGGEDNNSDEITQKKEMAKKPM